MLWPCSNKQQHRVQMLAYFFSAIYFRSHMRPFVNTKAFLITLKRKWATKKQKHSHCFPKLETLKRIRSLNSLISLVIMNGFRCGSRFIRLKKLREQHLHYVQSNRFCNSRAISKSSLMRNASNELYFLFFPWFQRNVCKGKLDCFRKANSLTEPELCCTWKKFECHAAHILTVDQLTLQTTS